MIDKVAIGAALLMWLAACTDNAADLPQPAQVAVQSAAANAANGAKASADTGPAATAPLPPEGAPGYDNSLRSVTAAVEALYAPYTTVGAEPRSAVDARPDYSAGLNRLITAWRAATADAGVTDLSEADWLCSCQDWDAARARLTINSVDATARGYDVSASFSADGSGPAQAVYFFMVEEGGRWAVDDMVLGGGRRTLRALLADETRSGG